MRSGDVAAFSVDPATGERVVVVVLARVPGDEARQALARDVAGAVRETGRRGRGRAGAADHGLPQTSSGKLSRSRAKANYLAGRLRPPTATSPAASPPLAGEPPASGRCAGRGHRRDRLPRPPSRRRPGRARLEAAAAGPARSPLPSLAGVEAEIVLGDLSDEAALARLVDGADVVVHAAGLIKARRPAEFFARQSRRHGAARRPLAPTGRLRPAVVAGGARAAALALRRQQARRRGGARPRATGPWLAVRGAGRLRSGRPRDPGLFPRRRPAASPCGRGRPTPGCR